MTTPDQPTPQRLLELQLTDSAIDQITNRLGRLPEVVSANAANEAVRQWEQQARSIQAEIDALEAAIAASEAANATITTQRTRLEQQLKTVIAPREAEALMHEIALLNSRRSELDDAELEAMEGLATAESRLGELSAAESALRSAAAEADAFAAAAVAASRVDIATKTVDRDSMRAALDPAVLQRYDTMRGQHNGVAIAHLNGLRCEGCHLDLSRGEVDDIKRLGPEELPECPNCGRLLVR